MKRVLITSSKFTGEIELVYNDDDVLVKYDATRAELTDRQIVLFMKYLPREELALQALKERFAGMNITEVQTEVTFDQFWKAWFKDRPKDNSSKKRSEVRWNRMTVRDQVKAYSYITTYMGKVKPGTEPKYAETYLNSEVWN